MAGRTNAGPMDFEYQNGTGPMDERSPFAQIGMNSQRNQGNDKKRTMRKNNQMADADRRPSHVARLTKTTGSFAVFGSPTKPAVPSLREPASQPHFFSSPPKPLPALPPSFRNNPSFNTPRKIDVDDFASSGGETPKSPERAADVDSDATPDMSLRSKFSNLDTMSKPVFNAGSKKEKESPSRRQSWWKGLSNLGSSPRSKDDYAHGAERKILKRRSKEKQQALARVSRRNSVSESEQEDQQISKPRKVSSRQEQSQPPREDKPHWAFTLFDFLTAHPTLPHVLSFYAQLFLNLFLIGSVMYILYSFWATIRSDVDKKSSEAIAELMAEMAVCVNEYKRNCMPVVPRLEAICANWEKCMNQDPQNVGRARVSAHTFAEIFNSFIEPISYKAMIFSVILIFSSVAISNFAFSIFRDKAAAHANAQHHHYYANNVAPPPTPMHGGQDGGYWTPYRQGQNLGLEPTPSQYGAAQIEGQGSPVRRLQFR